MKWFLEAGEEIEVESAKEFICVRLNRNNRVEITHTIKGTNTTQILIPREKPRDNPRKDQQG